MDESEAFELQGQQFFEETKPHKLFDCPTEQKEKIEDQLCVGITSVPRPIKQYLNMTVFSLYNQSSEAERCQVEAMVFNNAVNPSQYTLANEMR